jgi:hypothetical protein
LLTKREINKLNKIIEALQEILAKTSTETAGAEVKKSRQPRTRRTGKELAAFRKMLKAERRAGASAADLAKKHGVSSAYIYQL